MAESQATSARMPAPRRRRPAARRPSPSTRRRPPARKGPDLVDRGIDAVGRGVAKLGKAAGRALGRTREIDPAHRRDGLGVVLIVLAVVSAAGIWFGAGGPVGRGISAGIGFVVGRGAIVLPILLAVAGVVLMGTEPRPDSRPRVATGGFLLALGVLGVVHLAAGRPDEPALWPTGGGAIGYLAATPLATGLTAWVAAPVLVLLAFYAVLLLTATPVREVPDRVRRLLGRAPAEPVEDTVDPVTEAEPVALRRPARRRQASVADVYREAEPEPSAEPEAEAAPPRRPKIVVPERPPEPEPEPDGPVGSSCGSPCSPPPTGRSTNCRPATSCPPARCPSAAAAPTTR